MTNLNINNKEVYTKAKSVISKLYGEKSEFREGQYEAIEATMLNNRTLVVQKTGWGKSLIYFTCTKLLRESGKGVTVVVSPLLILMENQIEAAKKIGLKCDVINSKVKDRRSDIIRSMISNELDLVLVTPESLFSNDVQNALKNINIGLFVIDEAHCISDWGHDFRLKYSNIYKILNILPTSVPVLATTATANDRVVEDLKKQLGGEVYISRGSLIRKSLSVQILKISDIAERYAWILQNINCLPGSGIIYCLTQRDCDYLAEFLIQNGINVKSYYSRKGEAELLNIEAEKLFKENKIKALVATIKLGMGYDKDDINFVIHSQQPSNIVSYYQQIGRAGRNIERAYTFLMCGFEDEKIQNYFINTAFPTEEEAENVIKFIYDNNEKGSTLGQINAGVNCKKTRIDKALNFLQNEGYIIKDKSKYYVTLKEFKYNKEHYDGVTRIRKKEQQQMNELVDTDECYSRFIVNCLDDNTTEKCGICSNCLGYEEYPTEVANSYLELSQQYIERLIMPIEPRKQWATTCLTKQIIIPYQNEVGICISKYGDPGYGTLVKEDKYSDKHYFRDELVRKSASVLKDIIKEQNITAITCVPSLRSNIVENFAERLANICGLKCIVLLQKREASQQKLMQNSTHQCENALKSFSVIENADIPKNILLVDDVVDSKWTLTVCGYKLMEAGCSKVVPFALADSSQKEE